MSENDVDNWLDEFEKEEKGGTKEKVGEKKALEEKEPKKEEPKREEPQEEAKVTSFEKMIEKILKHTGKSRDELMTLIKKKRGDLADFVTPEGAATLVGKELGVDLEKKIEKKSTEEKPIEGKKIDTTSEFDKMFEEGEEGGGEVKEKIEEKKEKPKEKEVAKEVREKVTGEEIVRRLSEVRAKLIFTIFGRKGVGKTFQSLSFPGKIIVLSFDRKTDIIKQNLYNGDDRIKIYDMLETLNYSDIKIMLETANSTFARTLKILEEAKDAKPDWILIDCLPEVTRMAEFTMRFRNDLAPFEGIKNLNIWKERRMFIRQIHKLAYEAAGKGVIYTTDSSKDEIVEEGELVTKQDVPVWLDIIMRETDFVLKTDHNRTNNKHMVRVDTSKDDRLLKTGATYDMSNYGKIGDMMEK